MKLVFFQNTVRYTLATDPAKDEIINNKRFSYIYIERKDFNEGKGPYMRHVQKIIPVEKSTTYKYRICRKKLKAPEGAAGLIEYLKTCCLDFQVEVAERCLYETKEVKELDA